MKYLIFILCFCFSQITLACREVNWSLEQWKENSSNIYKGIITSVSMPSLEDKILEKEQLIIINSRIDRKIRMKIYETLKGKKEEVLDVTIGWCGGGDFKLGEMAVLFNIGEKWHAKYLDSTI